MQLNSGFEIPVVGLGTWKSEPGKVRAAVEHAIDAGYKHIDCASGYLNQEEIGDAIEDKINSGVVKREELFITSKLWATDMQPEHVRPAIMKTLKQLKMKYIDLYLIHVPTSMKHGDELLPKDENGVTIITDVDYVDTWKVMEELQKEGLTKSIGVSNFNEYQIARILKECSIPPCNNQVESHPYLLNEKLFQFCKERGISFTAYSPLCSPDRPWAKPEDPSLLEDPKLVAIATKHGKSTAQVLIRFQVQRGAITIPKSTTPARISSNLNVFGFVLSEDEMEAIRNFDHNFRVCNAEWVENHKYWPFRENYCEE